MNPQHLDPQSFLFQSPLKVRAHNEFFQSPSIQIISRITPLYQQQAQPGVSELNNIDTQETQLSNKKCLLVPGQKIPRIPPQPTETINVGKFNISQVKKSLFSLFDRSDASAHTKTAQTHCPSASHKEYKIEIEDCSSARTPDAQKDHEQHATTLARAAATTKPEPSGLQPKHETPAQSTNDRLPGSVQQPPRSERIASDEEGRMEEEPSRRCEEQKEAATRQVTPVKLPV